MGSGKKSEVIQDFDIANDLEVIQCPRCGILLSLCWEKCEKMYKKNSSAVQSWHNNRTQDFRKK